MVAPVTDSAVREHGEASLYFAESGCVAIPDVNSLSAHKAALGYAEAGIYLLPVDPNDPKNPGSRVGKNWPAKSTRDPDTIEGYWDCDEPPLIAIHTGRSGLVVFDLDIDVLPDELAWMKSGRFQSSRTGGSERGHYVFATGETFVSGKLTLTDGTHVGEIRSANTVIVTAPSRHAKADAGGRYLWQTTGPVPELPEVARRYLRPLTTGAVGSDSAIQTGTPEQVAALIELTANADSRPNALTALVASIAKQTSGTRDSVRNALRVAASESRIGFYPYARAIAEIETAARKSYLKRGESYDEHIGSTGYVALVANGVAQAMARDIDAIRTEATRDYGDKRAQRAELAAGVQFRTESPASVVHRLARNAPLDLRELRTTPPEPISWLLADVLPRDSYVSLSAAPGTGKSLITRAIAVDSSLGRSAFNPATKVDPARVIDLDAENGQDWWRAGLDSMGSPLDLPNLSVVCYPDVGGLDTPKGAGEFLALVTDLADKLGGVDLVVLDTVSRFIEGGENDADTWSQFDRLAIAPLRDQKVSVLRLDHLGKDADRGPRGSSHKLSDVDADYRMTATRAGSDDLTLVLGKRRRQHFAQTLSVRRRDSPLRHELQANAGSFVVRNADGTTTTLDPDAKALVEDLDRLGVDPALGRDKAQAAYNQAGGVLKSKATVWSAAVRARKSSSGGEV